MYEIYETESIIFRSKEKSENDKKILVFSRDFGLIWINSSGARKIESKFRSLIQDFSYINIFIVRGKVEFRMTGGFMEKNIFFSIKKDRSKKIKKIKSFFILIEKLLIKNHQDEWIFDLVKEFVWEIDRSSIEDLQKKEVEYIIKLLNHSGYFDEKFLEENLIDLEDLKKENIKILIEKINSELKKIAF